jgi:SM-20-related protein
MGITKEKIVNVFDDYIDEDTFKDVVPLFQKNIWAYGWKSTSAGPAQYWHCHFCGGINSTEIDCEEELIENCELKWLLNIWTDLKRNYFHDHVLQRVYANAHTYGLDGGIHKDNSIDLPGETAIIYMHAYWPIAWGGELQFYSANYSEICHSIVPLPKRLVIFNGETPHVVKPISRDCRSLRISLVFKVLKNKHQ